jgi:hypothetical protein
MIARWRPIRICSFALSLAFGAALFAGCATQQRSPASAPDTPNTSTTTEAAAPSAASLAPMTLEAREALPEGFPIEVPVLDGIVESASADDPDLGPWSYMLTSPQPPDDVAAWYVAQYENRSWQVVEDTVEGPRRTIELAKGAGAWTILQLEEFGDGTEIECWAGIGVPMPDEAIVPEGEPV